METAKITSNESCQELTGSIRVHWEKQLVSSEKLFERAQRMVQDDLLSPEQQSYWEHTLASSRIAYERALHQLGWRPFSEIDPQPKPSYSSNIGKAALLGYSTT